MKVIAITVDQKTQLATLTSAVVAAQAVLNRATIARQAYLVSVTGPLPRGRRIKLSEDSSFLTVE